VGATVGKAPLDKPALKPYRGKPAVRNFRGDDGNVGIIRSPVRAIALPDRADKLEKAARDLAPKGMSCSQEGLNWSLLKQSEV